MQTKLEHAVAFIKAGDTEKGKQLLSEVIKQNPRDENAWLWMTRCVTTTEQKKYCFDRVLQINPQNQHAIEGLRRLNIPAISEPPTQPKVNPSLQSASQPTPKAVRQKSVKKTPFTLSPIAVVGSLVVVVAFMCMCGIVFTNFGGGSSNSSVPTKDESGGSTMAYLMCQQFIEKRLVAPATADWPPKSAIETYTVTGKKNAFQIRGYVDAENRMGAFIRNYYVCEVSYTGNERWHLDYLEFEE